MRKIVFYNLIFFVVITLSSGCEFKGWNLKKEKEEEPEQISQLLLRVQTLETEKQLLQKENEKLREEQAEREAEVSCYSTYNQLKDLQKYLLQKYPDNEITQKLSKTLPQIEEVINSKVYKEADDKMSKLLKEIIEIKIKETKIEPLKETIRITAGPNLIELRERLDGITDVQLKKSQEIESVELIYSRAVELAKRGERVQSEDLAFQGIQTLKQILLKSKAEIQEREISDKIKEIKPGLYTGKPEIKLQPKTETVKTVIKEPKKREKVNVNTASADELQAKLGLEPSVAEGIVWYRENISDFEMIEELKIVPEMNDETFNIIKDFVIIK
ncbi:MAG: helix-hairpin-helix domain-containing protein [Candidatus Hydrogenedentota bacterium]